MISITLLFTASCSTPDAAVPELQTPTPLHLTDQATFTPPAQSTNTPRMTSPPTLTATPETRACTSKSGQVIKSSLQDPGLFRDMPFRVYLPPCYGKEPDQEYPTLYLLHGLQGSDRQWDQLGVDEAADRLISSGALHPFIIVMPWHRTGIDLIEAVPEILLPHIEETYAARPQRAYRSIGGLSKGGGQALEIGLKYPQLFSAVGMHSPAVQYLDAIILDWATSIPAERRPSLWIDIGMQDSLYPAAQSLITALQNNNIPITIQINEGDHLPEYWKSHLDEYLSWYSLNWKRAWLKDLPH
ncbi:MAG: alpha/beta hydrolase-fold protein [Anaerolineales bacterium]